MNVWMKALLIAVAVVNGMVLVIALIRTEKPLRRFLGGAVQGWCALAAVNVVGMFCGVSLGLNAFTTTVSGVLGVPGVIALLLLKAILTT